MSINLRTKLVSMDEGEQQAKSVQKGFKNPLMALVRDLKQGGMNKGEGIIPAVYSPLSLSHLLTFLARALREIKYYQSNAMAESLMIPAGSFQRLVKEISDTVYPNLRWEKDGIYALQTCTEHILVMFFEMT